MKISYRREMKRNYLIVEPEAVWRPGYEYQILLTNKIEGLLPFSVMQTDERVRFYYEITSRQPLDRLLEGRNITAAEIKLLVFGIAAILEQLDRFLLNENSILLQPEYIYVEPDRFRLRLCLVPGQSREFCQEYGKLLEYLLGHVDHQDQDCVILAYGLYQETRKENYGITDILKLMQKKPEPDSVDDPSVFPAAANQPGNDKGKVGETDVGISRSDRVRGWFKKKRTAGNNRQEEKAEMPWKHVIMAEDELPVTDFVPDGQDTVLLTDPGPQTADRPAWLRALDDNMEDIRLAYYPFIIGKQKNLVDYVLDKETVSRLHLKIYKAGDQYVIMDLNSTNGTFVNGVMLVNNGSADLAPGDEVQVALFRYRFEL